MIPAGTGMLEQSAVVLGVILTTLTILVLLARFAVGAWRATRRIADMHDLVVAQLVDGEGGLVDRVGIIERDLTTNGGSTLKDAVQSVEAYVDELRQRERRGAAPERVWRAADTAAE